MRERVEQVERGRVAPVQVLEHERDASSCRRARPSVVDELAEHPFVRRTGEPPLDRFALVVLRPATASAQATSARLCASDLDDALAAALAAQPPERFEHRQVRLAGAAMLHALTMADQNLCAGRRRDEALDDRRLADPRLSRDEHDPPLAAARLREQPLQLRELAVAADRPLGNGRGERRARRVAGGVAAWAPLPPAASSDASC